jgi:hypothetical protein
MSSKLSIYGMPVSLIKRSNHGAQILHQIGTLYQIIEGQHKILRLSLYMITDRI